MGHAAWAVHREFRDKLRGWTDARGLWAPYSAPFGRTVVAAPVGPAYTRLWLYPAVDARGYEFWGLNDNIIQAIQHAGHPWVAIYLYGSPESGYVLSGQDVVSWINAGWTTPQHKASGINHKFHGITGNRRLARHDAKPFSSFTALMRLVG